MGKFLAAYETTGKVNFSIYTENNYLQVCCKFMNNWSKISFKLDITENNIYSSKILKLINFLLGFALLSITVK